MLTIASHPHPYHGIQSRINHVLTVPGNSTLQYNIAIPLLNHLRLVVNSCSVQSFGSARSCILGRVETASSVHQGYVRGASLERTSVNLGLRFSKNDFLNSRWSLRRGQQMGSLLAKVNHRVTHFDPNISNSTGLSTR